MKNLLIKKSSPPRRWLSQADLWRFFQALHFQHVNCCIKGLPVTFSEKCEMLFIFRILYNKFSVDYFIIKASQQIDIFFSGGMIPPERRFFRPQKKDFFEIPSRLDTSMSALWNPVGRLAAAVFVFRGGRVAKRLRRSFLKKAENSWYFFALFIVRTRLLPKFVLFTVLGALRLDNIKTLSAMCLASP